MPYYTITTDQPRPLSVRVRAQSLEDAIIAAHHRWSRPRNPYALPEACCISVAAPDGSVSRLSATYIWPDPAAGDDIGCGPEWDDHDWRHVRGGGETLCRCARCGAIISCWVSHHDEVVYDVWV